MLAAPRSLQHHRSPDRPEEVESFASGKRIRCSTSWDEPFHFGFHRDDVSCTRWRRLVSVGHGHEFYETTGQDDMTTATTSCARYGSRRVGGSANGILRILVAKQHGYEKQNQVGARAATRTINPSGINHAGRRGRYGLAGGYIVSAIPALTVVAWKTL